jgi:Fe2+ or Zn2+ uptake regulation protein
MTHWTWKKDPKLKYTDLCIFIDENIPKIADAGAYPEIENQVYNYLWLLVKALAIKKCMFSNFSDYDGYATHAAHRLFFALRKNYLNQGKTIKGKQIRPIKSCLNYTKALLYPMKVEYQNEAFREIITEEFVSKKFDSFMYKEKLKSEASVSQGVTEKFKLYLRGSLTSIDSLMDKVLKTSPFVTNPTIYRKLKVSLLLNALNSLKLKKRLDSDLPTIIVWKLPKSMSGYVRVLLKEFYTELKLEILDCHSTVSIDDATLEKLICNTEFEGGNYEEQY